MSRKKRFEREPRSIRNVSGPHGEAAWMYVTESSADLLVDSSKLSPGINRFRLDRRQFKLWRKP